MSAITTFTRLYITGTAQAFAVYVAYGATATNTMVLSADFVSITYAYWFSSTGTATGASMTPSGTTVTVPTGPSTDDGYFVVLGARVQSIASA